MAFRLLEQQLTTSSDVNVLLYHPEHSNSLLHTIKSALIAREELQVLLQNDFTQLVHQCLQKDQASRGKEDSPFLGNLMVALVDSFSHAKAEENSFFT